MGGLASSERVPAVLPLTRARFLLVTVSAESVELGRE
jgi:hypothetical protein